MKYTYTFSIIDDEGNIKYEHDLGAEEAVDFLLKRDNPITLPAPVEISGKPEKRAYNKKPKEVTEEKATRAGRKPKYDRDALIDDLRAGKLNSLELAGIYHVSTATISNVAKEAGILRGRKKSAEGDAPKKAQPMDVEQYADLRAAMHDHEFQSGKYSLTKKIPLREVNFAVHSQSYQHYLKIRYDE